MKFSTQQLFGVIFVLCVIFAIIHNVLNIRKPTSFPTFYDSEVENLWAAILTPFYIDFCLFGLSDRWPIYTSMWHMETMHPVRIYTVHTISCIISISFHLFILRTFCLGMWRDFIKDQK